MLARDELRDLRRPEVNELDGITMNETWGTEVARTTHDTPEVLPATKALHSIPQRARRLEEISVREHLLEVLLKEGVQLLGEGVLAPATFPQRDTIGVRIHLPRRVHCLGFADHFEERHGDAGVEQVEEVTQPIDAILGKATIELVDCEAGFDRLLDVGVVWLLLGRVAESGVRSAALFYSSIASPTQDSSPT